MQLLSICSAANLEPSDKWQISKTVLATRNSQMCACVAKGVVSWKGYGGR